MNNLKREALGAIARLAEQMSYAAMNGHAAVVKAQFDTMKKHIARLETIENYVEREAK